jgi:PAT family beta-lactamase induction signal transducer AmpG
LNAHLVKKLITALIIGLNSGLVYAVLVTTTTAYLKDINLSLAVIGFFSIKMLPFSFKYFWSPFVDNHKLNIFPNNFGQRKSWMISMQLFLFVSIASFGFIEIKQDMYKFALIFLAIIAFLAATYDIGLDAYRIELFSKKEAGLGNSFVVYGFRIGFIISGVFGLFLSSFMEWKYVFVVLATFILPCILIVALSSDKKILKKTQVIGYKKWFTLYFVEPIKEFSKIPRVSLVLLVIAFYKVGDAYLDTMSIPFLMDVGFSKNEIAGVAKTFGILGIIIGTFAGSFLITKLKLVTNLLLAEILASITNLQFLIFLKVQTSLTILAIINFIESLSYGISNIILITYMSSLCDKKFTATHYSILISISALSRGLLSPTSGFVAENFGWQNFFILSSSLSLPSIMCIYMLYSHNKCNVE